MNAEHAAQHRLGLLLVATAALFWSTSGIFVRLISADLMTMLFWRGVFSGSGVMLVYLLMEGKAGIARLWPLPLPVFAVAACSAIGMITGIGSMRYTTVAEALIIYATVPFVTAAFAWLFIGEKPSVRTIVASLVALAGVALMMKDASWDGSLFGKGLAVLMTFSMAAMTTIMRGHQKVPMLPAMAISAWLCSFVTVWFAAPLAVSAQDLLLIALFGIVQNASGLILYAIWSRKIPAAEATLIAALEVPFTPLWVWLFLGETPAGAVLLGGGVVMLALFGHILTEIRPRRALPPPV
ncbi:DMT family transporter [Aestuariivirga sp. YIM B02566]|uniref:DMT family transporter n=1 Tax=Taklimakanibacter albus TaxID=2800327 RepID=A0ACC5R9T1_9HYPH|nr:DMT family transporter [Aestuariivirga sp. YIM B02566]MBK1869426.1 DMT family transporter [Aestuariivirga sp. YIM B02566]